MKKSKRTITKACVSQAPVKKIAKTNLEMAKDIRRGLPYSSFEETSKKLKINQESLSKSLGLNPRTLIRRKKEQKLHADESDRLYRVIKIFNFALEVLKEEDYVVKWLSTPKIALGGEIPLTLLDTEPGFQEVENLLGQIEYGVYS